MRTTIISTIIILLLSVALMAFPAHAEHIQSCNGARGIDVSNDLKIVCSATWKFDGTCLGKDMWDKWTVSGQTKPEDAFVHPWADAPITVIGYELVKLQSDASEPNGRLSWFMIGSAIYPQPDAMLFLAPGETHSKQIWPPGMGQVWPSKDTATLNGAKDMIDLHGTCFGGGPISIFLTIYYTPNGSYHIRK